MHFVGEKIKTNEYKRTENLFLLASSNLLSTNVTKLNKLLTTAGLRSTTLTSSNEYTADDLIPGIPAVVNA